MKNIKTYFLSVILFFFLFFNSNVLAQGADLHFDHINYDVSFSQSMISSIHQTRKGFIWIGTANGLISYDGYNFLRYAYNKDILTTISNSHINIILEDNEKELWVGTNNGLNLFNKKENNFLRVDVQKVKGGRNYISSIIQDDNNRIWVGTFGGVKRLNKQKYLLEEISNDHNSLFRKSRVLSLFYHDKYGVLVGTAKGLQCFDPKNGSKKKLPKAIHDNAALLHSKIWKVVKEKNGDLWFATETNGAFHYSETKKMVTNYVVDFNNKRSLSSNWINDIVVVDSNTIWFATKNGLCVFNKAKNGFANYRHNALTSYSLSDDDVKCFLKDRHGDIWVGTNGGGVNFFQKTNTNFINITEVIKPNFGLNNAFVNAVVTDSDGTLWVGTNGGGLNHLNFQNNKNVSYLINYNDFEKTANMITSLVHQNTQNLYCGTFKGLFRFNKSSKTFSIVPLSQKNSKEGERPITSLLMDNGDLWVGTNGNGLKKVGQDGTVESYMADGSGNSISDNFITDIANRNNGLWIATQYGLNFFDKRLKKVTKVFKTGGKSKLPNNSLTVMFTDSKNRFWIGAESGGINLFDEKSERFFEINKTMGFTDETIKSISEDSQGNIWVSDNNLLYKIKTKKHNAVPKISDFEITYYSSKNGLKVKQFSNNSSTKLNDRLVFGSSNGLIIFNPSKLIKTKDNSEIVLTKLIVNNEEIRPGNKDVPLDNYISETSEITLGYDQGYIGLEFSAMNFVNPEKNEYAYKLESSFNKDDWHTLGNQHYINLTNLNSGTYLLKIKTSDASGKWNPSIKTLKITMLPPWWKTWWAFIFYFALLLAGSVALFRFFRNRELLKQAFYLEQVEKERQEELYKMKLDFFTNVSHEIRTPLTLISGPVEELLSGAEKDSKLEHKLKIIKNNSDRLLKLVNELMDFRKAEKGSMKIYCEQQDIVSFCFDIYESFRGFSVEKKIDYKFVLNINTALIYFDKNQMEKVIYNLLSNAFKFTNKGGRITLAVEQKEESDTIEIKVKDNGIGIPENRKKKIFKNFFQLDDRGSANLGSGIGLALSKSIVELHHGEIKVQTEADANFTTIFTITLKKGKDHFKKSQIVENSVVSISESESPILDVVTEIETYETDDAEDLENGAKKTILVIDDNEEVLAFISDILHAEYRILKFTNGQDALDYMEKEIPDIIVSDVMMPELDGFELCKILKTSLNTNHIPVVMLTAKSSTLNRIEGLSTGADAYISKPFSIEELRLTITNLLSSKEIMRQKYGERFISDTEQENVNTPEGLFVKKLTHIIESNIDNPNFDVNDLVNEIGMSRTVLYKKVQTLTNHSVAGFIKNMRLKKAANLLMNTSYSVSEVTYMVGFNDRKHFSKEFKKFYNLSPTIYKSSNSSQE